MRNHRCLVIQSPSIIHTGNSTTAERGTERYTELVPSEIKVTST